MPSIGTTQYFAAMLKLVETMKHLHLKFGQRRFVKNDIR